MTAIGRPHIVRHVTGQPGDHTAARGVRHREPAERVMAVRRRPRLSAGLHALRVREQPPGGLTRIGIAARTRPGPPIHEEHRRLPPGAAGPPASHCPNWTWQPPHLSTAAFGKSGWAVLVCPDSAPSRATDPRRTYGVTH